MLAYNSSLSTYDCHCRQLFTRIGLDAMSAVASCQYPFFFLFYLKDQFHTFLSGDRIHGCSRAYGYEINVFVKGSSSSSTITGGEILGHANACHDRNPVTLIQWIQVFFLFLFLDQGARRCARQ